MNLNDFQQGQPVRVYRNLHKRCYSVQARLYRFGRGNYWKVGGHRENLHLTNVRFVVNEAGRRRVLREKKKNVHAFIQGEYQGFSLTAIDDLCLAYQDVKRIAYNPYQSGSFTDHEGREVATAERVWLTPKGVYAIGVTYASSR